MDNLNIELKKEKISRHNWLLLFVSFLVISFLIIFYLIKAPLRSSDVTVHVTSNDSLLKISNELKENKVINEPLVFKVLVSFFSGDKHIPSGDYLFKKNESLFDVSWQVGRGIHGVAPIRFTFKEGITNIEIANLLASKLSVFNKEAFLSDERSKDGYLFPDTYFFFPLSTNDEIINELTNNFKKRIASFDKDIKSEGVSLSDIIIMASILEKEAGGKDDGAIISGILWKRIKLGMLLQVDAAPITYKDVGLPSTPISNPGISTINYAMHPQESPYLFYLHDSKGQVHYAITYSEHRSNIARYLK